MSTKGKESGETPQQTAVSSGDGDSIKVFVRVRPLTQGTGLTTDGDQGMCLTVTSPNTIRLHAKPEPRTFTYDHVADVDVTQEAVFASVARNIVESCVNGYNGTIFAYGQTGSGKTFTMLGPSDSNSFTDDLRGVIPRSFECLFFLISREVERSGSCKSFLCKCSFIEIYNEQIYDLLDSASASLFLRENIKKGVFVEGAVEKIVTSAVDAYQVLSMGWRNRRVASTSMNRESSRSHAVFTMTLESKETVNEVVNIRTSQLNLVDLAGSERQKDTHTEGSRLKEASSINRSLMCLGQVIMALVDVSNGRSRHICYRDSKLTFLLRDSLGGNARTYIIANVHPGSKCFGETLSTLQFAQRAKLIKNKAMINEDTQGNVKQLQAELKKLKEQLTLALAAGIRVEDGGTDVAPGGPQLPAVLPAESSSQVPYQRRFTEAMLLWRRTEEMKKSLLQKLAQLEEAWTQKEKFIHSNRMILKFREDHISRLEVLLKGGQSRLADEETQNLVNQLQQEIKILKDQVERHPRMIRYAAENFSLREENRQLRALESVRKAVVADAQTAAELEVLLQSCLEAEKTPGGPPSHSTSATMDSISAASVERLKSQLVQKQAELTATVQALEEYKEVTKKQLSELESEKRYLEKSNMHLENILEATKAHKNLEVSQLNKLHMETIKSLTTPTKTYNLRSRLVPLSSPEHCNSDEDVEDIRSEPPPPDMNEVACETLAEELRLAQEQAGSFQNQLDEEQAKGRKLQQQIAKLEEQVSRMKEDLRSKEEMYSSERGVWTKEQQTLQESVAALETALQEERGRANVLNSEVHDLRVVLQSADKELEVAKGELEQKRGEQDQELERLSSTLISTQLQLDNLRLESEQVLEERRHLQDALDTLQAEMKFEADQCRQRLEEKAAETDCQQAQLAALKEALQSEREHTSSLTVQLREDQESTSKELVRSGEENAQLRSQVYELSALTQQQAAGILGLERSLSSANAALASLEQKTEADKAFVVDLINQTRDLRSDLGQKEYSLALLTGDLKDITAKYTCACGEREELRRSILRMEEEIQELREASQRRVASDQIAQELLQEDLAYAAEEVDRLTRVLDEQAGLLQAMQDQAAQKEATIQELQGQLKGQEEQKLTEGDVQQVNHTPRPSVTPKGQSRTPHTPQSFGTNVSQLLESQVRELEDRRSSMMTMEVLLAELNTDRAAKAEEIHRLKVQLNEKEITCIEIQTLLDKFYKMQGQPHPTTANNGSPECPSRSGFTLPLKCCLPSREGLQDAIQQSILKQLQEEKQAKIAAMAKLSEAEERLQRQDTSLVQSQRCIQELTNELRNRCLELRDMHVSAQQQEKLLQEVEVLRRQVDILSEENGKLVGHQNHRQKIEYLVKLKKDNTKLIEENELLRSEIGLLKESRKV
ncbi:kinesin-like protein KIF15 isoform X1 [Paramormyrops kingsleyae]|uniref:kinesin-like protein KIF15 isoform X1 n=1 Tax=Paramormyrops kingsleyae TaxID=1676925 RepID=UPI003B9735C4